MVARQAHNLKAGGSIPSSATKAARAKKETAAWVVFFCCSIRHAPFSFLIYICLLRHPKPATYQSKSRTENRAMTAWIAGGYRVDSLLIHRRKSPRDHLPPTTLSTPPNSPAAVFALPPQTPSATYPSPLLHSRLQSAPLHPPH